RGDLVPSATALLPASAGPPRPAGAFPALFPVGRATGELPHFGDLPRAPPMPFDMLRKDPRRRAATWPPPRAPPPSETAPVRRAPSLGEIGRRHPCCPDAILIPGSERRCRNAGLPPRRRLPAIVPPSATVSAGAGSDREWYRAGAVPRGCREPMSRPREQPS